MIAQSCSQSLCHRSIPCAAFSRHIARTVYNLTVYNAHTVLCRPTHELWHSVASTTTLFLPCAYKCVQCTLCLYVCRLATDRSATWCNCAKRANPVKIRVNLAELRVCLHFRCRSSILLFKYVPAQVRLRYLSRAVCLQPFVFARQVS